MWQNKRVSQEDEIVSRKSINDPATSQRKAQNNSSTESLEQEDMYFSKQVARNQ